MIGTADGNTSPRSEETEDREQRIERHQNQVAAATGTQRDD